MSYDFNKCELEELKELIQEHIDSLSSPFDSFLEEHIVESIFFRIDYSGETIGYFAIFKGYLLTQYHIKQPHYSMSQHIFEQILTHHPITSIFVPTCDEFLLSTVIDSDYKIKKQAYFFQDSKVQIPQERLYQSGHFRKASLSDVELILEVSQDFFDQLEDRINDDQIFVLMKENILLGVGIVEKSTLQQGYASVGMYTNENFRQLGVGRTIIHRLKKWCYNK